MKLQVKKLREDAILPTRGSVKSSGLDLYALEDITINVGQTVLVKTGIAFGIPEGFEIQVRPRSGMALNKGVTVLNTPGTVDSGYRGEIGVILYCTSPVKIEHGDRIAQLVLCPVEKMDIEVVEELSETERGSGGFGSTGIK